jgi:hypothetical protein
VCNRPRQKDVPWGLKGTGPPRVWTSPQPTSGVRRGRGYRSKPQVSCLAFCSTSIPNQGSLLLWSREGRCVCVGKGARTEPRWCVASWAARGGTRLDSNAHPRECKFTLEIASDTGPSYPYTSFFYCPTHRDVLSPGSPGLFRLHRSALLCSALLQWVNPSQGTACICWTSSLFILICLVLSGAPDPKLGQQWI